MRIAFDTSILVYMEGHTVAAPDTAKVAAAIALLGRLRQSAEPTIVLPA